jgi:hypothetical protein
VSKTRFTHSHWVGLIAGPILSLIAFVVTYYMNPLNFGGRAAVAAIPAFLLAIVILLIGHNLAAYRELERASSDSDRIYEAVKDYLHVTKVGSPQAAMQYVIARLPILQEVKNTSFNLRDEIDRADDKLYDTPTYIGLARHISDWTAKDLRWKDIGDPRALDRLREVCALAKDTANKRTPHYQYRLISHNEPQINFILLNYPDGTSEVLFNWDFRNIGQDPVVLLSRDRDIVEMFAIQFEYLWRAASLDHDSTAVRSTSKK